MSKLIEPSHYQSQGAYVNEEESLGRGRTGESRCFSLLFTIVKIGFSESPHCL